MDQLPPDSHAAIASQLTLYARLGAGASSGAASGAGAGASGAGAGASGAGAGASGAGAGASGAGAGASGAGAGASGAGAGASGAGAGASGAGAGASGAGAGASGAGAGAISAIGAASGASPAGGAAGAGAKPACSTGADGAFGVTRSKSAAAIALVNINGVEASTAVSAALRSVWRTSFKIVPFAGAHAEASPAIWAVAGLRQLGYFESRRLDQARQPGRQPTPGSCPAAARRRRRRPQPPLTRGSVVSIICSPFQVERDRTRSARHSSPRDTPPAAACRAAVTAVDRTDPAGHP